MRAARRSGLGGLLLALAVAAACTGGDRQAGAAGMADTAGGASATAVPVPVVRRADSLAHTVARLLRRGDADSLARLTAWPEQPPHRPSAEAAIAAHARYFAGDSVVRVERVRTAVDDTTAVRPAHATLVYALVDGRGRRTLLTIAYDAPRDHLHPHDELLRYAWQAQGYARAVTAALRDGDAMRLARQLTVDDLDYPPALAEQAIAAYRARVDLATLTLRDDGLAPERDWGDGTLDLSRPFLFTLRGTKDGRPVEHRVRVVHGDGLVGWVDAWVPAVPQT